MVNDVYSLHGYPEFRDEQKALSYLDDYPIGATIEIYFDPDTPQRSVMSIKTRSNTWFGCAGLGMLVMHAILLLIWLCVWDILKEIRLESHSKKNGESKLKRQAE